MVRKLAFAVAIALGTLSVPVHAVGLGELRSESTLNQNFAGDIRLLSVRPDELDSIRVELADAAAFERAGVERLYLLSQLKFEPILDTGGTPVVRVSSDFPIREPFLNFLVEVNWPNGRLLREYSVLLDPPVTTRRRPPATQPATQARRTTTPAAGQATAAAVPGQYGPVRANETAWGIASRLRPDGVTMEQMMIALLNANPQAFVNGDINRLRRGQILRVPSVGEIRQLSRSEATAAYRAQQEAWLARRDARLQAAAPAPTPAAPEPPAPEAAAAVDDQLRIVPPRPDGEGEAGAGENAAATSADEDLEARLMAVRENAETSRQEAEALRSRLDDLEARLADMQRLLTLKNDQLAQLQDRIADESAPLATAPAAVVEDARVDDAAAAVSEPVPTVEMPPAAPADRGTDYRIQEIAPRIDPDRVVENYATDAAGGLEVPRQIDPDKIVMQAAADAIDDGAATGAAETAPAPAAPAATPAVEIETAVVGGNGAGPTQAVVADVRPVEPVVQPAVDQPAAESPSDQTAAAPGLDRTLAPYLAMLEQNIVPVAIGGVLLLMLIGAAASRRGRDGDVEPVSAASAEAGVPVGPTPVPAPATAGPVRGGRPEELTADEIAALQDDTEEVDPVSEADVYITYGRYQLAEELLNQALNDEPDRLALRHKLLEVHYATRNAAAFSALAQQMADSGQASADATAWARACNMGRELDPGNPLFGGAPRPGATAASVAAGAAALSLTEQDIADLNAAEPGPPAAPAPTPGPAAMDAGAISLEELDSLEMELTAADAPGGAADRELPLDLDYDADALQAELDELSELSALDSAPQPPSELEPPGNLGLIEEDPGPRKQQGLDQPLDLTTAFDQAAFDEGRGEAAAHAVQPTADADPMPDSDPVATKLDLARAYLEMGDADGARGILQEVIAEGSDAQRGDAQRLLDGLA